MDSSRPKRWRVKRFSLALGRSRRLCLSARRFRTRPERRAKSQLVFQPDVLSIRELVFSVKKVRPKSRLQPAYRQPFFAPLLMIIFGAVGTISFASALEQPVKLDLISHKPPAVNYQPKPQEPQLKSMPKSDPVRLQIPRVGIDTPLVPTGLKADGTIAMPDSPDVAAWYDQGPTPGEIGPSIIAGHVDRIGGIAVFWRLRELVPGDNFSVIRADGTTANFKVTDAEQFPQDQFPTSAVYGKINYAGIRLITCGGVFNTATHHYSHNTVIYGQLD